MESINGISENVNNQTVKTPKIILQIIIISLISITFFSLGILFTSTYYPSTKYISQEKIVKIYPTEKPSDLLDRCGDMPMIIYKNTNRFDRINGPDWSPDCRHIAWSVWESGTGYIEDEYPEIFNEKNNNGPSKREGIFILTDANQNIEKIYSPKEMDETPTFIKWENKETLLFSTKNIQYSYSLSQKKVSRIEIQ